MKIVVALPLIAALIGGCAVDLQEPGAQLASQYAVMKWIGKADDPVVRAHRVMDVAEALEANPATVPVDQLKQAVMERVSGFDPADRFAVAAMMDMFIPYVDSRDAPSVDLSDLAALLRRAAWYYL